MHGCLTEVDSNSCAGRHFSQETRSSQAASEAGESSGKLKESEQSRNAGERSADKAAEPEVETGHAELAADRAKPTDIAAAINEEGRASGSTKTPSEDQVSLLIMSISCTVSG